MRKPKTREETDINNLPLNSSVGVDGVEQPFDVRQYPLRRPSKIDVNKMFKRHQPMLYFFTVDLVRKDGLKCNKLSVLF